MSITMLRVFPKTFPGGFAARITSKTPGYGFAVAAGDAAAGTLPAGDAPAAAGGGVEAAGDACIGALTGDAPACCAAVVGDVPGC